MTRACRRHGATTLFAALNILDSSITGRNTQRHGHPEFIRFLEAPERDTPAGQIVRSTLDNCAHYKRAEPCA